ncbi:molybdate ABC transporter substrate-binding protein [Puniceicoccaceae bacterium K14]|nr:molybdate ABC transporter substrate-binding protein [Puniceicoccaceae bacterium K14]
MHFSKRIKVILTLLLIALTGLNCCDSYKDKKTENEIIVYAAASLADALHTISGVYQNSSDSKIVFNFSGSGTLAQQLVASPKADIFISANTFWMDKLDEHDLITPQSRIQILKNKLVIIAHKDSSFRIEHASDLAQTNNEFFALGHPDFVPAGSYAKQWLEAAGSPHSSLWQFVSSKASYATDARSVLHQVIANRRLIGFVYKTDYMSRATDLQLLYEIESQKTSPIIYSAARLNRSQNLEEAKKFLDFLRSPSARSVFEEHGFMIANPTNQSS